MGEGDEEAIGTVLVVRSLLSIPDSSVDRPTKKAASGAMRTRRAGNLQHQPHH
jgi:hypothetical protein